jgi:hypothetical protein
VLQQRREALQAEIEAEAAKIAESLDPAAIVLRPVSVAPRKADLAVGEVALAWAPWRRGADGFPEAAFE